MQEHLVKADKAQPSHNRRNTSCEVTGNNSFHDIPKGWRRLLRLDTNIWPATSETNTSVFLVVHSRRASTFPFFILWHWQLLISVKIKNTKTTGAQTVQMVPYVAVCVNLDQNQGELQGASPYCGWLTFLWTSFSEKQISPPGSIKSHIIVMYTGKSSKTEVAQPGEVSPLLYTSADCCRQHSPSALLFQLPGRSAHPPFRAIMNHGNWLCCHISNTPAQGLTA